MTGERIAPALIVVVLLGPAAREARPQPRPENQRRLTSEQRRESLDLVKAVDRVAGGELPGGDVWLTWNPHFMRAPDGKTYVPFTLTLKDAPEAFATVGMYVRAVKTGADPGSHSRWADGMAGANAGEIPVNVPERQFVRQGTPTPGENSAILAATERYLRRDPKMLPFEDLHFAALQAPTAAGSRVMRRALALPAGEYDLYIAIGESGRKDGSVPPQMAVLHQALVVPDFSGGRLQLSSIVMAEKVAPLAAPLSARQQVEHPYAFGTAEIVPALDSSVEQNGVLSLFFFVYNAAADAGGRPRLTVQYRFFEEIMDRFFIATAPQVFDHESLGPDFDLRATGNALAVDASIPMQKFRPGPYRLAIDVTDGIAGTTVTRDVHFSVVHPAGGRR